jgi:3-oxoacyl-[acyl-carrier-protein] synthase-3
MVHGELGCPPCEIASTAGVCCSSINALKYAWTSVAAGATRRAVVTGSDLPSAAFHARHFQPQLEACGDEPFVSRFEQEFLRWMLSDGAGAVVVESKPRPRQLSLRIDWIDLISYAGQLETCMYGGGVKQDGVMRSWRDETDLKALHRRGYFNLTQDLEILMKNMIPVAFKQSVERIVKRRELSGDRIEWMLPHLSSFLFEQEVKNTAVAAGLVVPDERWFTNLAYKGNTGAASMFIMLEELVSSGRAKEGDRIVCTIPESGRFAFGYIHLTAVAG